MSSNRRKSRTPHNRNPKNRYKKQSHHSSTYHGKGNRTHYLCDICGSNVPGSPGVPPLCPRCNVPMQPILGGQRRNPSKNNKNRKYDYSSKIFYPTDGHPQYIGLPADHPDPEDKEAVAKYMSRKPRNPSQRRPNLKSVRNRGKDTNRRHPQPKKDHQIRRHDPTSKSHSQSASSNKQPPRENRTETTKKPQPHIKTDESKPKKPRSPSTPKSSKPPSKKQTQVVNEDDYQGTALSENQSTFSLANQSFERAMNSEPVMDTVSTGSTQNTSKENHSESDKPAEVKTRKRRSSPKKTSE